MTPAQPPDPYKEEIEEIAAELGISEGQATDVLYLRTRYRWSEKLEKDLVADFKNGVEVNICTYGCTPKTGAALLEAAQQLRNNE